MEGDRKYDSLDPGLRYKVSGTGPQAESAHGKYIRRVIRYMRSKEPVQWLIATEAISRPSAVAHDEKIAGSPSISDSGGEERHGSESDSDRVSAEIDHLAAVRRVLFPNGANGRQDNDASYETAGGTLPLANGQAEAGLTVGSGQQPTPNFLPPALGRAEDEHTIAGSGEEPAPTRGQNAAGNLQAQASDVQDNTVELSKAQIAAQRSARRRDASGRFLPMDEGSKQTTAGENSLGT